MAEFEDTHNHMDQAECDLHSSNIDTEEREWLEEIVGECGYELQEISAQIRELKPSKYMMKNYPDLEYILEFTEN